MDAPIPSPNMPNPNTVPQSPRPEQLAQPAGGERQSVPQAPAQPEMAPPVGGGAATPPLPPAPAVPAVPDPMALAMSQPMPAAPAPAQHPVGSVPLPNLAADVDVIEPEWVDKAEDVVRQHLGDPFGEEEAVEALQEDYLQKRYGFTVQEPDEGGSKSGSA